MFTGMKVAGLGMLLTILFCLLGVVGGGTVQGQWPNCDDKCRERLQFSNGDGTFTVFVFPECSDCVGGGSCANDNQDPLPDGTCTKNNPNQAYSVYPAISGILYCEPAAPGGYAEATVSTYAYPPTKGGVKCIGLQCQ
jgi:hypothetical protein